MLYVINDNTYPPRNFAIEEYLMKDTDEEVFMLWRNEHTVIIGKNQDAYAEVNMDYLKENNIGLHRRKSGGGAVYHDLNNLQYSYISSKIDAKGTESFKLFARPVVDALKSLGLNAEFTGRNDILIDGEKVSGNAQYRNKGRIVHHGTLLFKTDKDAIKGSLYSRPIKFQNKSVKSVESRVGSIDQKVDMNPEEFMDYLKDYVIDYYDISEDNILNIKDLPQEVLDEYTKPFEADEWNLGRDLSKDHASFSVKYPYGLVEYKLRAKGGIIDSLYIQGDYFESEDVEKLAQVLIGKKLDKKVLEEALDSVEVTDYINGMDKKTLIDDLLKLKEEDE